MLAHLCKLYAHLCIRFAGPFCNDVYVKLICAHDVVNTHEVVQFLPKYLPEASNWAVKPNRVDRRPRWSGASLSLGRVRLWLRPVDLPLHRRGRVTAECKQVVRARKNIDSGTWKADHLVQVFRCECRGNCNQVRDVEGIGVRVPPYVLGPLVDEAGKKGR